MANGDNTSTPFQFSDIDYTIHQNIDQELIVITEDKLQLILIKYEETKKRLYDWISPLGMFITLLITWGTTDFKDAIGLSKDSWKAIFVIATIAIGVWLVYTLYVRFNQKDTKISIIEQIKQKSKHLGNQ